MKKITQLSKFKIRWLNTKILILLLSVFLTILEANAQTFSYTGSVQTVTLPAGSYEIEAWGADGGDGKGGVGGKGGYSTGILNVTSPITYYIYVGGKGITASAPTTGGWNGGGSFSGTFSSGYDGGTGGGGTDIRTTQNTTYADRIIVAGGGGGGVGYSSYSGNGGNGGGTNGEDGSSSRGTSYVGSGGTQTAGGAPGSPSYSTAGDLGIGGNFTGTLGGTAGGGGYYGGGGGHWGGAGGGGSSYIGGVSGGVTIMFGEPGFVPNPDTTGNGTVVITNMAPCTGTPTAGTASITPATRACASESFTLSVSGSTRGGGITYQWQRSDAGANNFSDITGATSSSYTVTNQTAASDYRYLVTCTNSNSTDTSNVVTMAQPSLISNLSENFDTTAVGSTSNASIPSCWSYIDEITTTGYGYVEAATAQSSPNSFRLYRTNSTTNAPENLVLISPQTDNLGNGTKQLRFSAMATTTNASNILQIVRSDGTTSSSTFTVIQNIVVDHTGYKEYIVPLPATTDDYFGFRLAYNNTTTTIDINLDDVYYEDVSPCIFPMNLNVSNIGESSVDISWDASIASGVTGYYYEVRDENGTVVKSGTVTGTLANITGLTAATNYTVYVRSVCGLSDGPWTLYPVDFMTLCPVYGNFYENFDTTPTGTSSVNNFPICWSFIDEVVTSGYGYVNATNAQSGSNSYRLYKTNSSSNVGQSITLISPETDNLGGGGKQVRFSARASAASNINTLEIVSLNNNTSSAIATVITTINVTGVTYVEYIVPLPITTDDYFGFRLVHHGGTAVSTVHLDDVYYEDAPPPAITDVNKTDVLCYDANTGEISVEVEGGALPLTYDWTPAVSTTDSATGLAGGTYTITVTDALNRTATETITITEPTAIVSNSVVTNISCNGANDGIITIAPTGGVGPYTYLWNTNDTGTALTGLSAGTYSVTITDASGCTLVEDVIITEPDVLDTTGTQTDVSLYNGNDGEAVVTVTGGTSPYTYAWSPSGGTSDTASNLTAGTYTVVVTDANGCTTTKVFTITQPIPLMVQTASQTNVNCNGGSDGTASVSVIGGNAPYTYLWTPTGGTSETATGLSAGVYNVEITDSTSNTITESFTITEPGVIVATISNKKDVLCNGAKNGSATVTVTGGTAPFTYVWSNGTTTTNATVNNLDVGTYTVMITDANGCSSTTPATVTITQPAAIVINSANTTNVSCYGQNNGSVTVSVSGGVGPYTYTWSNGQSGTTISNLTKGNYTVTVTDANNCTKTQTFTITEPAFVNAPVANNPNFCAGQNATLNNIVITGSNIKWYDAATGSNVLPATTALVNGTTYYATQTVGNCESARTPITVNIYQATPLTTTQLSVCSNTRIQNMTIDGFNYTQLKWYDSATSTTPLVSSQLLATQTYYISSVTGTCESSRQAVQVTVAATVPAPTASAQTVCSNTTLNDLVVTKDPNATLNWYSSTQSMIPLANTTVVTSGTYYVQQVIGNCESSRVAVAIQVTNVTTPSIASITTCEGITIGDLNIIGSTNYIWYTDNSTTTALPDTYVITSGTYYIANEFSGCISARKNVAVNVSARPGSPTGQTAQVFGPTKMVSDIKMDQPNVSWFGSYDDAVKQINEIPKTTQLQDQTYYGILTNANGCGSMPTAVEVTISLGVQELDLAQLSYYPNPADSELNISYIEEINKVEIFTITGQKVLVKEFKSNEVKVDLSGLSSATYMVRIQTEKASQFIKIIKK